MLTLPILEPTFPIMLTSMVEKPSRCFIWGLTPPRENAFLCPAAVLLSTQQNTMTSGLSDPIKGWLLHLESRAHTSPSPKFCSGSEVQNCHRIIQAPKKASETKFCWEELMWNQYCSGGDARTLSMHLIVYCLFLQQSLPFLHRKS